MRPAYIQPSDEDLAATTLTEYDLSEATEGRIDHESSIIAVRRYEAHRLRCAGWTLKEIGDRLGVSHTMVSKYLKAIRLSIHRATAAEASVHVAREFGHLDLIIKDAYDAWMKSRADRTEEEIHTAARQRQANPNEPSSPAELNTRRKEKRMKRDGDPRFLAIALKAIETRAKMLGLLTPDDRTRVPDGGVKIVAGINPEDLV